MGPMGEVRFEWLIRCGKEEKVKKRGVANKNEEVDTGGGVSGGAGSE